MSSGRTVRINKKKASEMIGKIVLVGLTYRNEQDEITDIRQYFGIVDRINTQEGLVIVRGDNQEEMSLPPRLGWYRRARPGIYNLKSSNYSVRDPDYVATLSVYPATTRDEFASDT